MSDVFKMEIRLDGESMNEFGRAFGKIAVEFPALMLADTQELSTLCKANPIDLSAVDSILERLVGNAKAATQIGDAVATIVGMCTPERISGGTVQ
jgi:hypothetical protein